MTDVYTFSSKAVANGAVAWAIDSVVSSRISKVWYGVCCAVPYDRRDQQHVERERDIIHSADGKKRLPNGFQLLLAKVSTIILFTRSMLKSLL
jgi:hypothetical protein